MLAVDAQGLSKHYGDFVSLVGCDFRVRVGTVFGLLGPNGAGKTTLLRTLLGFIHPTGGHAQVCGFDIRTQSLQVRSATSYLPGDARLYRSMKGKQILELFGGLHPHGSAERSRAIAARLELDLTRRVMFMSTGMRQKLAVALSFGCRAPLVVLDEPTANLDPSVRATVLELVREVRADGRTVILSSHIFSDVDDTCDEVAILRGGRIAIQQSLAATDHRHIVVATLADQHSVAVLADQAKKADFVEFFHAGSQTSTPEVHMHLRGDPADWLSWLADQPLMDLRLERAGIRATYEKLHLSESPAQTCPEQESRSL